MRLFILSAGTGSRLFPLTKNTPKSLLDLGDGTTILERQINFAYNSGIFDEICIVTGYKTEQIEAKIRDYKNQISISTIYNPFYDITNNFVSMWIASNYMLDKDFAITNGDNIYKESVFNTFKNVLNKKKEGIFITIDYKNTYDEDDMKVRFDNHGNVLKISKTILPSEADAESVGFAFVLGNRYRKVFVEKLHQLIKNKEYLSKFWLEIFNALVESGCIISPITIEHSEWREIDFHPDVNLLKELILKNEF